MNNTENPRFQDRMLTRERMEEVVSVGSELLKGTNLAIEEASIGERELGITRRLLQAVAPIDVENYRLHSHLQLAAKFARKIGEGLKNSRPNDYEDLNLDELEILALLHDFGRFTTHRFYRNDIVGDIELKDMGMRPDLIAKLPTLTSYMKKDPNNEADISSTLKSFSIEQKIIELSDVHGKRRDDGGIPTFEEVMVHHRSSRQRTGEELYASERKKDPQFVEYCVKIYERLRNEFAQQGVDVDKIREEILKEEQNSPIRGFVFDIGDVLLPNPEADSMADIAQAFGISEEIAKNTWVDAIQDLQTGQIDEMEMWKLFSEKVRKPMPDDPLPLSYRNLRVEEDPKTRAIIERLKKKGYTVTALTDTISSHLKFLTKAGIYEVFDAVVASPNIGASKKTSDVPYRIAALNLWLPPQACFFVDDKSKYVEDARDVGMKGVQFTSPEQLEEDLKNQGIL